MAGPTSFWTIASSHPRSAIDTAGGSREYGDVEMTMAGPPSLGHALQAVNWGDRARPLPLRSAHRSSTPLTAAPAVAPLYTHHHNRRCRLTPTVYAAAAAAVAEAPHAVARRLRRAAPWGRRLRGARQTGTRWLAGASTTFVAMTPDTFFSPSIPIQPTPHNSSAVEITVRDAKHRGFCGDTVTNHTRQEGSDH
uniref:Uncharacterized protein n=1 Tax=Oryza punctata TaxID=4537 RepID=A0A0E0KY79_ORYPU